MNLLVILKIFEEMDSNNFIKSYPRKSSAIVDY